MHAFIPVECEVDIKPFLQQWMAEGRLLVTPQTLANRRLRNLVTTNLDNLQIGVFNTRYASSAEQYEGSYDIILVPGLAFTASGYRLGHGGGYYDTFLAQHPEALKVGVGYPSQLVDQLPIEDHDITLDIVLLGDHKIMCSRV